MQLRDYQKNAIDMLYQWFDKNKTGNPVLNMPGGSGKSVVIASIVKDAMKGWPDTRILMLVHSMELISQNADKLRKIWPNAPLGIYSASLNKRDLGEPILYCGIGSVAKRAKQIGHIDICIVDECHAISNTENGIYRKMISDLISINPDMRVIGFSASPYRLGHGLVTEGKDALFKEIIEPVTIEELVSLGYLAPLRSKHTKHILDTKGLHKRNGDYIASEMEERFNTNENNYSVVDEIINKAKNYKHWLIFCSGILHAKDVTDELNSRGIKSAFLTSKETKKERETILNDFESGKIQAICNVGILTTGYDFPDIDCIAFLRATQSPGLYLQSAVRGMRPKTHTDHCLVLDFAGVVETHGPITKVIPPRKHGDGTGEAPIKICDHCHEIVHASAKICPACGEAFPPPKEKLLVLHTDDIMTGLSELEVSSWSWRKHTSKTSGIDMLAVSYYGGLSDNVITSYYTVMHDGFAGVRARRELATIASNSNSHIDYSVADLNEIAQALNKGTHPNSIAYKKNGKFFEVVNREWSVV